MTTEEVAKKYYQLSQEGKMDVIVSDLYSENVVSIEPDFAPTPRVEGKAAVIEKGKQFNEMIEEVHGGYTNKPIVAGIHFTCAMGIDCTYKGMGRSKMDEIAVFEVQDGKIVKEQFFYQNEQA